MSSNDGYERLAASGGENWLAVFDCDGTLVDSQHNIVAAMSRAFRTNGLPEPDPHRVRRVVGLHLGEAISRLVPDLPEQRLEAVQIAYVDAFRALRERQDHEEPLFPGVTEVLDALTDSDTLLAVATGKSLRGLQRTLHSHGLVERFLILKTADDGPGKPDPQILLDAIMEAGASQSTAAMVGDTVYDMTMARRAETLAIGVTWGYHDAHELEEAGAHAILGHFDTLPMTLETFWKRK